MQLHQTQSLVLKTTSYRDKDLVVHFLTKEFGKKLEFLRRSQSTLSVPEYVRTFQPSRDRI